MTTFRLTWLPRVLRAAGLTVIEVQGWETRGHGDVGQPTGVLVHDTAGRPPPDDHPSLNVVVEGRTGKNALAGPLCELFLSRGGVWYVVAAGKAWHAGPADNPGPHAHLDGNAHLIGIEAENDGLPNDPWPEKQMASLARGCAALLRVIDQPVENCIGHKEYAPSRKQDPDFPMGPFRDRVRAALAELKAQV